MSLIVMEEFEDLLRERSWETDMAFTISLAKVEDIIVKLVG